MVIDLTGMNFEYKETLCKEIKITLKKFKGDPRGRN